MKTKLKLAALALLLSTFNPQLSTAFAQGSLTPPGAPVPTMKTLDQVEPRTPIDAVHTPGDGANRFIISAPGSYYLTGNLTGVTNKNGIAINADNVTVDLNGFALMGVTGSLSGIYVPAAHRNLRVHNGSAQNWGGNGIDCYQASNSQFDHLRVSQNAVTGLVCGNGNVLNTCSAETNAYGIDAGDQITLTGCTAVNNGHNGLIAGFDSTMTACTATGNGGYGLFAYGSTTITACTANKNGYAGITTTGGTINAGNHALLSDCLAQTNYSGIVVGETAQLSDCWSISDGAYGFSAGYNFHLGHCVAENNSGSGFGGGSSVTLIGCSAAANGSNGIETQAYSLIRDCVVTGNLGSGIIAAGNTLISDCAAAYNTGDGISVNSGSTVSDCLADNNVGDGIKAANDCRVTGNNCNLNGFDGVSYGIHITGNFARIEGNHAIDNSGFRNLKLNLGTTNLVIRNTVNGAGTNSFNVPAGNLAGPLLTNAVAVLTNSNPNANFAY